MNLNHYEVYVWWYAFAPTTKTPKVFSDYLATLKQGKMEFFGETINNGMYEVPDEELNKPFLSWLDGKRKEDKRKVEQNETNANS